MSDGSADDELIFLTMSPTPLGEAGVVVRLFNDRDSAKRSGRVRRTLQRRADGLRPYLVLDCRGRAAILAAG